MSKVAFVGAGRMASAMVGGIISGKHYLPTEIACTCGDDDTGRVLSQQTGISHEVDAAKMVREADVIVLACKPQQFNAIDEAVAQATKGKLVLSILAGTPLSRFEQRFPEARNIVRAMPNTPGQIGAGITAYSPLKVLSAGDEAIVTTILGALGEVLSLPEDKIDAVTAVSGSGPAYIFEFAAALREAGIKVGLEADVALRLAIQTILGSAKLLAASDDAPETLRNNVTSPGGTTQAALESMGKDDFRGLVERAVKAARDRSIELAKG